MVNDPPASCQAHTNRLRRQGSFRLKFDYRSTKDDTNDTSAQDGANEAVTLSLGEAHKQSDLDELQHKEESDSAEEAKEDVVFEDRRVELMKQCLSVLGDQMTYSSERRVDTAGVYVTEENLVSHNVERSDTQLRLAGLETFQLQQKEEFSHSSKVHVKCSVSHGTADNLNNCFHDTYTKAEKTGGKMGKDQQQVVYRRASKPTSFLDAVKAPEFDSAQNDSGYTHWVRDVDGKWKPPSRKPRCDKWLQSRG